MPLKLAFLPGSVHVVCNLCENNYIVVGALFEIVSGPSWGSRSTFSPLPKLFPIGIKEPFILPPSISGGSLELANHVYATFMIECIGKEKYVERDWLSKNH